MSFFLYCFFCEFCTEINSLKFDKSMKKSIKSIIFVVVFGVFMTATNVSFANNQNPERSDALLVKGNVGEFEAFMNNHAAKFIRKHTDWKLFTEVVTLYNTSTSKFLSLDKSKQEAFLQASNEVCTKLAKMHKADAKNWYKKVKATTEVAKYLWNYKVEEKPLKLEDLQVIPSESSIILGR